MIVQHFTPDLILSFDKVKDKVWCIEVEWDSTVAAVGDDVIVTIIDGLSFQAKITHANGSTGHNNLKLFLAEEADAEGVSA